MSIFNRNLINSPLLRLPVEIRQSIYEYAIGEFWIHVFPISGEQADEMKHGKRSPRQLRNTKERCRARFSFSELQEHFLPEEERYVQKMDAATTRIWGATEDSRSLVFDRRILKRKVTPLCLALVCRLLYQETYLLPYQRYMFSFANSITVKRYLSSIAPVQRQTISKLMLSPSWGLYTFNYTSSKPLHGWTDTSVAMYPSPALSPVLRIRELQKHWGHCHTDGMMERNSTSYAIELVNREDIEDDTDWVACVHDGYKILVSDRTFALISQSEAV